MSIVVKEEVQCPCGEVFESELYHSVSVREDPELKDLILAGELNVVKCPSCFQMVYAERFVLYHDVSQELLAFVYPRVQESRKNELKSEMEKTYSALQNDLPENKKIHYKPFLLFGLDALCDLLIMEDEISDEGMIVESICDSLKLGKKKIHKNLARELHVPPLIPFLAMDGKNGKKTVAMENDPAGLKNNILGGLDKILKENNRLVHYKMLLTKLKAADDFSLKEDDLISDNNE